MDKNSIIGIVLIGIIMLAYSMYMQPTEEEMEATKQRQDSIQRVEQMNLEREQKRQQQAAQLTETQPVADSLNKEQDSLKQVQISHKLGKFAATATGTNQFVTLENDKMKLTFSTQGARPYSVELKNFQTHDSLPLVLFTGDENCFGLNFLTENKLIKTENLFFKYENSEPNINAEFSKQSVVFRLYTSSSDYIEYKYTLEPESFIVNFDINFSGMDKVIAPTTTYIDLVWATKIPSLEKSRSFENDQTILHYKHFEGEVDELSARSTEEESISTKLEWIAFSQQFFASVLISKDAFLSTKLKSISLEDDPIYLKKFEALTSIPYSAEMKTASFDFYFGPKNYNILSSYDLQMEEVVELGWPGIDLVNKYLVIPLFGFLGRFIDSYGLIILIMTVLIKLALSPLTYKSFLSTAKMKVLKPEIDAINAKISKDKPMERQQATMALYRRVGVNPMGGCLPMLLQFPFLVAMFRFFPSSIELRQKSFLWATDLSSYDSIFDLPFSIPAYGDHISLFTLLMAASMILTMKMNSGQMNSSNSQMPGMQYMMYFMPVMMLFWFNNYSAGLSYYYLLSNLITFGQMTIIRRYINEEELLQKLKANKKKPAKKSKFQQRLEEMAKQQKNNRRK